MLLLGDFLLLMRRVGAAKNRPRRPTSSRLRPAGFVVYSEVFVVVTLDHNEAYKNNQNTRSAQ